MKHAFWIYSEIRRQRIPKGKSIIDNSETLATLGTQETGQRHTKHKETTHHRKLRR